MLKIKQLGTDENVNHRTQLLANQFFLERSFASRWSRASRNQYQADLNVTGDLKTDQPAVTINFANISLDQLEALGYPDDGYDDEA